MEIKDLFVSYSQAKRLIEKEIIIKDSLYVYDKEKLLPKYYYNTDDNLLSAPSLQELLTWWTENYDKFHYCRPKMFQRIDCNKIFYYFTNGTFSCGSINILDACVNFMTRHINNSVNEKEK